MLPAQRRFFLPSMAYMAAVKRIKRHPIGSRKLKTVTADHLQVFIDFMRYGVTNPDGTTSYPINNGYICFKYLRCCKGNSILQYS